MNQVCELNIDSKIVKEIAKAYSTLDYVPKLRNLLNLVYPEKKTNKFCKLDLHKEINNLLLNSYEGEPILKYKLFKAFVNRDVVAAYEIKVKNSRVDFLTVDDATTSFEIKSSLDNLNKLSKQSSDYLSAFDFNNIVIHERHLVKCLEIVPKSFGIITVHQNGYEIVRKPTFNKSTDPFEQLNLLTKKELLKNFGMIETDDILKKLDNIEINKIFKLALKERYKTRWDFIVKNSADILPIDLQFFFKTNVEPALIYN
ncbi:MULTISPECIES: sce7726 family protein [Sphingobacterium]|uniref:sce7726 family protein n=1 Tax=Sphingobacterium TaxID=28453 RepID=UPI00257DB372|nr:MULTISPECIES: sce7726 family protein [Sphingobacterium]